MLVSRSCSGNVEREQDFNLVIYFALAHQIQCSEFSDNTFIRRKWTTRIGEMDQTDTKNNVEPSAV